MLVSLLPVASVAVPDTVLPPQPVNMTPSATAAMTIPPALIDVVIGLPSVGRPGEAQLTCTINALLANGWQKEQSGNAIVCAVKCSGWPRWGRQQFADRYTVCSRT
ncbi:hypothetical protein MBOE_25080 [Mycolicibacterium boenickei]|uniref:Uncharacterized protein n=1 Tax=Mycolicibacterium boenickei TaxID=146017 RepID=A0ABN5ZCE8_9MYCO|nr:hypothetical protein MBOE_25080 [Mycolicibacterium boenickei]